MNRQTNAKGEHPKCVCCGKPTEWKGNRKGYVCKNHNCDSRVFNYAHQIRDYESGECGLASAT